MSGRGCIGGSCCGGHLQTVLWCSGTSPRPGRLGKFLVYTPLASSQARRDLSLHLCCREPQACPCWETPTHKGSRFRAAEHHPQLRYRTTPKQKHFAIRYQVATCPDALDSRCVTGLAACIFLEQTAAAIKGNLNNAAAGETVCDRKS